MNKSTTLNKLKILNIRNPWLVSIVNELSNRRGASAGKEPLYRSTKKRMKAGKDPTARKKFNIAVNKLKCFELLFEKETVSGTRYHLLTAVWHLEDAIIESIKSSTVSSTQGRRININWKTILKEVRKILSSHNIKLPMKVTQTLVRFFLLRQCRWKLLSDNSLIPPKSISKKKLVSPEEQQDLFV
ncbi:MAG: hypothetical protein COA74_13390 [Gammaproteobacteria bacterium]|nr:MAG: hypothetical protein COA74_13390 [Gammaproteobacteria bacterium]